MYNIFNIYLNILKKCIIISLEIQKKVIQMKKLHPIQYLNQMTELQRQKTVMKRIIKNQEDLINSVKSTHNDYYVNKQENQLKQDKQALNAINEEITKIGKILEDIQNNPMEY